MNTSTGLFHADGQCQKGRTLLLPFYSHTFPRYVPVISRTVDFNLPRLLETTGERAPFRGDGIYPTTFASILNSYNFSLPFFFPPRHCKRGCLSNDTSRCGTRQGGQSIRSRKMFTDISPREWLRDDTGSAVSGSQIPVPGPCCREGISRPGRCAAGL